MHACRSTLEDPTIDAIRQLAITEQPDLFITDFEPLTALAADSLKIPCVSVDNQHRFCRPLGSHFPIALQMYGRLAGEFVSRWIRSPRECIVSVFHDCPPSPQYNRVDAMLREQIARRTPTDGDHILLYGRTAIGRRMAEIAATIPAHFIAYGFTGPAAPNIEYRRASYDRFAADLASARAVVGLAGHQLISETRYFGKPLLVVPMPNQHEQAINARYVQLDGIGDFVTLDRLSADHFYQLLRRRAVAPSRTNGIEQALDLLGIANG